MTATRPLGPPVDPRRAKQPERVTLPGRRITIVPLDTENHAAALYDASHGNEEKESVWTYLSDGPYASLHEFQMSLMLKAQSTDPLFYAVIDNDSGRALGYQTFLRIDTSNRVIEVGNIMYTPLMQRTASATEAQFLFAQYAFDTLGNRRYEWKCNDLNSPSKRAAERLGFMFEGVFRQHMIVKGRNRDTAWFAMLDSEWPSIKRAYESWLSPENFDGENRQKRRLAHFIAEARV